MRMDHRPSDVQFNAMDIGHVIYLFILSSSNLYLIIPVLISPNSNAVMRRDGPVNGHSHLEFQSFVTFLIDLMSCRTLNGEMKHSD